MLLHARATSFAVAASCSSSALLRRTFHILLRPSLTNSSSFSLQQINKQSSSISTSCRRSFSSQSQSQTPPHNKSHLRSFVTIGTVACIVASALAYFTSDDDEDESHETRKQSLSRSAASIAVDETTPHIKGERKGNRKKKEIPKAMELLPTTTQSTSVVASSIDSNSSSPSSPSSQSSSSSLASEPSRTQEDHASCRACRDGEVALDVNMSAEQYNIDTATPIVRNPAASTSSSTSCPTCPPCYAYTHSLCPLNRAEVGRASWAYLHTLAAFYPSSPSQQTQRDMISFIQLYMKYYPCGYCADRSMEQLEREPIEKYVHDQKEFAQWMCRAHNEVNERLGKPIFNCEKVQQRWRDGPSTGECD